MTYAPPTVSPAVYANGSRVTPYRASFSFSLKPHLRPLGSRVPRPSMATFAQAVADKHGVTLDALKGPCRARCIAWPRQEAYWKIYSTGFFSMPQIGQFFGDRDHSTVHHGIRAHAKRIGTPLPPYAVSKRLAEGEGA